MKSTFRILFYLKKNEPKKDGTVTIMARITVDGETKQFSTKKTILPEDWDIKSGRAVNKSGKSTSAKISKLNKELDDLRGQISIQYTKQLNNNGYVEPEKLRNNVLGIEEKQHSLLTYFTEHNLQYKDKVGTTAGRRRFQRYAQGRGKTQGEPRSQNQGTHFRHREPQRRRRGLQAHGHRPPARGREPQIQELDVHHSPRPCSRSGQQRR